MIHETFFQSEGVAEWSMRQRLLVIGMISIADDQGRLKGNPFWLRAQIFPYDTITADEIESDLFYIAECNDTILMYHDGERDYIQLVNWWDYQSLQWAKPSDFPPPDGWQDKIRQMVYKPERWVMTVNWPNSPDVITYEDSRLLGNKSGNVLGNAVSDALPIININTNTNNRSLNKNKEKYEIDTERDKHLGEYVNALASIVKETCAIGVNDDYFERVAGAVLDNGGTTDDIKAFDQWWKDNGDYQGRPYLKSFLQHFKESIEASKPNMIPEDWGSNAIRFEQ